MHEDRPFLERIKKDVLYGRDILPPVVDLTRCKGCGRCVDVCTALALEVQDRKSHVVHGERCYACGHCWAVCPEEAVSQIDVRPETIPTPGPTAIGPDDLQFLIRGRRSTRFFKDQPVSEDDLLRVIEAARYSPTSTNRQDVDYVVLSTPEIVDELRLHVQHFVDQMGRALDRPLMRAYFRRKFGASATDVFRYYAMVNEMYKDGREHRNNCFLPSAPAAVVVHAKSFDPLAAVNCSMALYNGMLMAHAMDLATCFLGFVPVAANQDRRLKDWLGIPKENEVFAAAVIGHPGVKYRRLIERKKPDVKWLS